MTVPRVRALGASIVQPSTGRSKRGCMSKCKDYTPFFLGQEEDTADEASMEWSSCYDSDSEGSLSRFIDRGNDLSTFPDRSEEDYVPDSDLSEDSASSINSEVYYQTGADDESVCDESEEGLYNKNENSGKLERECRSKFVDFTPFFLSQEEDTADEASVEWSSCYDSDSEGSLSRFIDRGNDLSTFPDRSEEDYVPDSDLSEDSASSINSEVYYQTGADDESVCDESEEGPYSENETSGENPF